MGEETSTDTRETAMMQGTAFAFAAATPHLGLVDALRGLRATRRARRALARELADYATVSDRDDLAALIAGRGDADSDVAAVLVRQARGDLFRAS
jgi:hypothetical protein